MLHNSQTDFPKVSSGLLRWAHPRRGSRRRRRTNALLMVERMEERTLLSTFTVTNTSDSGDGSLRQAILNANADTGNTATDTIDFAIPGTGVHTIQPLSPLPVVTHPVLIDGYSQPGASPNTLAVGDNAVLAIELDGSFAGPAGDLHIMAANTTVRGLDIHNFAYTGIWLDGPGGDTVQGCFIGTDPTGETALSDNVYVTSGGNLIGTNGEGMNDFAERNIVSTGGVFGFTNGNIVIEGANNNVVAGNYIGTDATGTKILSGQEANLFGVFVNGGSSNRIGVNGHDSDPSAEGNVISGNGGGVLLQGGGQNVVAGNFIGTDATGTQPLGNGGGGVVIQGSDGNLVGTDGDGVGDIAERNVNSANLGDGIDISQGSNNNVVAGNFIGTDVTGTQPLGNTQVGINISYASNFNRIGTDGQSVDNVGERNIISGSYTGIDLGSGAPGQGNRIAGNFIGTDVNGNPIPGAYQPIDGIDVEGATADQIGGSPALANIIANYGNGVVVQGTSTGISILGQQPLQFWLPRDRPGPVRAQRQRPGRPAHRAQRPSELSRPVDGRRRPRDPRPGHAE